MLRGSVDTVILFPCSLFEVRFRAERALQKHRPFRAWLPHSLLGLHHPFHKGTQGTTSRGALAFGGCGSRGVEILSLDYRLLPWPVSPGQGKLTVLKVAVIVLPGQSWESTGD